MSERLATRFGSAARTDIVRFVDSYASLLVLLLANFLLLELVDDRRWGAVGSTLLSALALLVAISDPDAGHRISLRHWILVAACVALAPIVLIVNSASVVGLTYLLPVALLVTATLPITINRVLHHRRVTYETVLGALCAYVLIGLLFAFLYLAVNDFRDAPFFAQPGTHSQGEFLYFSFVALTTLGFGDLSPSVGLPQALTVIEALLGSIFLVTLVARLVTLWVRQDVHAPARAPPRPRGPSALPTSRARRAAASKQPRPRRPPARRVPRWRARALFRHMPSS
jgi:voltage-gated potassium channel